MLKTNDVNAVLQYGTPSDPDVVIEFYLEALTGYELVVSDGIGDNLDPERDESRPRVRDPDRRRDRHVLRSFRGALAPVRRRKRAGCALSGRASRPSVVAASQSR